MVVGTSRIWWEMNRQFTDPLPHIFQLQTGNTGNPNATDWIDVGSTVTNGYFALDDAHREGNYGKRLLTHYRVKLVTSAGLYVSQPVATYGEMGEKDWLFAREMNRKESLRHELVSREGYLLKRMRFGQPCDTCVDPLTGEILDSKCPECNGVGFKVGYHAPTTLSLDMSPEAIIELRRATEPPGPSRPVDLKGRILGFPQVNKEDVWVDAKSDQRWFLHEVLHLSEWRGIPVVIQVGLRLAPYTDQVYQIEVGGEDADLAAPALPGTGPGTIRVDHDYCDPDALAYHDACGNGIVGATILAFTKADYDAGSRDAAHAVASSSTMANGRWSFAMLLCEGVDYVLVFEKPGLFGPDTVEITARACDVSASSTSSNSSFWSSSSVESL
jgi:hypothetical protein